MRTRRGERGKVPRCWGERKKAGRRRKKGGSTVLGSAWAQGKNRDTVEIKKGGKGGGNGKGVGGKARGAGVTK